MSLKGEIEKREKIGKKLTAEIKDLEKELKEHRKYRMIDSHRFKILPLTQKIKKLKFDKKQLFSTLLSLQRQFKQNQRGRKTHGLRRQKSKRRGRLNRMTKKERDEDTDLTQKRRKEKKQRERQKAIEKATGSTGRGGPKGTDEDPIYTRQSGQRGKYNKSKAKKMKEKQEALARAEVELKKLLPKNMGGSIYEEGDTATSKERKRRSKGTALDRAYGSNVGLSGHPSHAQERPQGVQKDEGPLNQYADPSMITGKIKVIKQGVVSEKGESGEELSRREKIAHILDVYADELEAIKQDLFRRLGNDERIVSKAEIRKMSQNELMRRHLNQMGYIQKGIGVDASAQTDDINKAKGKAPAGFRRVSNIPGQEFVRDDISKSATELRGKPDKPSPALKRLAKMKSDKEKFESRNRIRYAVTDEDLRVRAYNQRYGKDLLRETSNIGGQIVATPRLLYDRDKDRRELFDEKGRTSTITPLQAVEGLPFQDTQREAFGKLKENRRKGKVKAQAGIDSFLSDVIAGAERRIFTPKTQDLSDFDPNEEPDRLLRKSCVEPRIAPPEEIPKVSSTIEDIQAVSSDLSQLQERLEEKQRRLDEEDKEGFLSDIDETPQPQIETDEDDFERDVPQLVFPSKPAVRNKMKQRAVKQIQGELSKQKVRSLTKAREYFVNPGYFLGREPAPLTLQDEIVMKELEEAKRKADKEAEINNPFLRRTPVLSLPQPVAKGKVKRFFPTETPPKPKFPLSAYQVRKDNEVRIDDEIVVPKSPVSSPRPSRTQKRYSTNPAQRSISEFFTKEKREQAIKDGEELRELKKKLVLNTGYKMKFLASVTIDKAQNQIREAFKEYLMNTLGLSEVGANADINEYLEPIFQVGRRVRKAKQRTPKTNRRRGRKKK